MKQVQDLWQNAKIEQILAKASPKQERAVQALDSGEYNIIALMGGNQSGKSYIAGCMAAYLIRDELPENSIVWVVSPNTEKSIGTPQRYLWEFLPHGRLNKAWNPATGFGGERPGFIYDPDGRNIIVKFKTGAQYDNDPDSFESETVTGFVWVDESIEERVWNAIQPRIAIANCPVIVSTIPRMDWMFDAFEEAPPESKVYFDKLLPMDNPVMTQDGYDRLAAGIQSEEERDMRLFGKFMYFGGIVYKEFIKDHKPDGHLVRPFRIPADWPKWRVLDVGMDHPTVCLWCAVSPDETLYVYREYRSRNTPIVVDAERIVERSKGETYNSPCIIDSSAYQVTKANQRSVAQQFEDAGVPCTPAVRVGAHIREWPLVQNIKRALWGKRLFIFDDCEGLIGEFRKWKFKRDVKGEPIGDSFEDKNNDGLDALKYWVAIGPRYHHSEVRIESTLDD